MPAPWEKYAQKDNPFAITQPQTQSQLLGNENTRLGIVRNQQDIENNPLNRANTQTNIAQGQQSLRNNDVSAITGLQKDFRGDDVVKAWRAATPNIIQIMEARPGGEGDLSVIYGWAKAMDAMGSVREGDTDLAKSVSPFTQRAELLANQVRAGNFLSPEVRTGLIEEARSKAKAFYSQYKDVFDGYSKVAHDNNLDASILNEPRTQQHFTDAEKAYVLAHGGVPKVNGVPVDGAAPPVHEVEQSGFGLQQPEEVPGAKEYRTGLFSAMRAKQIKSYEDTVRFTEAFNQQHGTDLPPPMKDKGLFNAIAAAQKGKAFDIALPQHEARTLKLIKDMRKNQGTGTAFKHGVRDAVSLGAGDELRGAVEGLTGSMRGEGSFADIYRANRDAERFNDNMLMQDHPFAYTGGELAGGLAMPGFGARSPLEMARLGAAYGGAYGLNSGQGGIGDRLSQGVVGAATGAGAGFALPHVLDAGKSVINRFSNRAAGAEKALEREKQIEAAQAAKDLKIDMPRFVAGGATAQKLGALADQSQIGAPFIRRAGNLMLNEAEAARDGIASATGGTARNPEGMGGSAIIGGNKARQAIKGGYGRLYDAAESLSGDARVPLPTAKQEAVAQIAELRDTPGGTDPKILGTIQDIADSIDGAWTPSGIRRMRTQLRERFIQSGSDVNDASRRADAISRAAEQDMINGLRAAGKGDAATAWQKASQARASYQQQKEQIFDPILGAKREKSATEVASALRNAINNNPQRVREFIKMMPPEEANDVRASLIGAMGNPKSGSQDVEGAAFSLNDFLTHWNDLKNVREHVFDPQTVGALNKLAKVAERAKQSGKVENHSNSGSIAFGMMNLGAATGAANAPILAATGHGVAAATAVLSALGVGLSQAFGAKLLASPNFARRLAGTPMNPASAAKYWSSENVIGNLIRSEPAMEAEIRTFQHAVNDNFSRVAASPDDSDEEQKKHRPY